MTSIIITGANGVAGSGVLKQILSDASVRRVTALSRSPFPEPLVRENPKLEVVLHEDFTNYASVSEKLKGHDACFWCLGISQSLVSAEDYIRITNTMAVEGLKAMHAANPENFTFCFVSGQGADSSEKSWITFAKVKGKTENDLKKLGMGKVYAFRPGFIYNPDAPQDKKSKDISMRLFGSIAPWTLRNTRGMSILATDIGKAMTKVAREGHNEFILENAAIRSIADSYHS